ncbi:MAG: cysteinyl-tRNA synthetase [Anaerolineales bacterium]|jgi:hypothetical protein
MNNDIPIQPGPIALFGSGETAPGGQRIFDFLFQLTEIGPRVSVLETPAGFELNSPQVAGSVGDFIEHRLQNYKPSIEIIPARKKGTPFSPDEPDIVRPILDADLIFMGPGSPSYAVRQLRDSLAWEYLLARHRLGAGLAFSSATTVAVSCSALPVYEIYKVGEDLHWLPGLDFFGHYGLELIFIPHWNNQDGGEGLDTSRCYMGKSRFAELIDLLPPGQTVIGIDENTGLVIDFQAGCLHAVGQGTVTIIKEGDELMIPAGSGLDLSELGEFKLCDPLAGISSSSWQAALQAQNQQAAPDTPDEVVVQLADKREDARRNKNWELADQLRGQIEELGWTVQDNPDGYQLEKLAN